MDGKRVIWRRDGNERTNMVTLFLGKNLLKFGVCSESVVGFDGEKLSLPFASVTSCLSCTQNALVVFIIVHHVMWKVVDVATYVATGFPKRPQSVMGLLFIYIHLCIHLANKLSQAARQGT